MDSRWVLIDTDKRAILRRHPEEFASAHWAETVEQELPMKLDRVPPEACETVGERTATYSQCDMNGHMNNARYVDAVCDALPPEVLDRCLCAGTGHLLPQGSPARRAVHAAAGKPRRELLVLRRAAGGEMLFLRPDCGWNERAKAEEVTNP